MHDFSYALPQETYFGAGSISKIPELIKASGAKRPLIVSDELLEKLGVVGRVEDMLRRSGIAYSRFLAVEANPSVETVDSATAFFLGQASDSLIALGGGSPLDVAKAVAILAGYGGNIVDYEGYEKVPGEIVPIVAVPTTAGTGSEATGTSVINDHARQFKFAVCSKRIVPRVSLLDPELIMTLPQSVAANTSIDAFIHCFEAYVSVESTPFSDCFCEKGLELAGKYLRRFVANRRDEEAASGMMLVSNFGGIGCAKARLGTIHAMAHPVSAYFGVPHGAANAILMPAVAEFNALADCGKYERVYQLITQTGGSVPFFRPQLLVDELARLVEDLGIPTRLSDVGVRAESIPGMAADAMKSGNVLRNPRQTTLRDAEALFRKSL